VVKAQGNANRGNQIVLSSSSDPRLSAFIRGWFLFPLSAQIRG